jgi:hypothetical protein
MKKLTVQQYNTLKALHANNSQGKSFEEYLEAVCLLKDLEYDPSIHDEVEPKVPLQEHISRSEAGLADSSKDTHEHVYKRTQELIMADNPKYTGGNQYLIYNKCKCGRKIILDLTKDKA